MGWFLGFKLHAAVNQQGQLAVFSITAANPADNSHLLPERLTARLEGFLYGNRGCLTKLAEQFKERGLQIITRYRKNMGLQPLSDRQRCYLRQRGLVETVFGCLKNLCDMDHTRHRSPLNFFVNAWAALVAYTFFDRFPSTTPFRERIADASEMVII